LRNCFTTRDILIKRIDELTKTNEEAYNIAAKPNERRADWASKLNTAHPPVAKRKTEVDYFIGCLTSFPPISRPLSQAAGFE